MLKRTISVFLILGILLSCSSRQTKQLEKAQLLASDESTRQEAITLYNTIFLEMIDFGYQPPQSIEDSRFKEIITSLNLSFLTIDERIQYYNQYFEKIRGGDFRKNGDLLFDYVTTKENLNEDQLLSFFKLYFDAFKGKQNPYKSGILIERYTGALAASTFSAEKKVSLILEYFSNFELKKKNHDSLYESLLVGNDEIFWKKSYSAPLNEFFLDDVTPFIHVIEKDISAQDKAGYKSLIFSEKKYNAEKTSYLDLDKYEQEIIEENFNPGKIIPVNIGKTHSISNYYYFLPPEKRALTFEEADTIVFIKVNPLLVTDYTTSDGTDVGDGFTTLIGLYFYHIKSGKIQKTLTFMGDNPETESVSVEIVNGKVLFPKVLFGQMADFDVYLYFKGEEPESLSSIDLEGLEKLFALFQNSEVE